MNNLDTINRIFGLIADKRLGAALSLFQKLLVDRVFAHLTDRYEKIQGDYDLLLNYMRQSYADPSRAQLYNQLLAKLFRACADALLAWKVRNVQSYTLAAQRAERRTAVSEADIRQTLENYVADVAMLQLVESGAQREQKEEELFKQHADFTDWLFDNILVAKAWNNDRALFYQHLILAPTVDTADAALIVAAVTLACMNIFDPLKWKTLTQVYRQHPDEKVRQRALVGWAIALPERLTDEGVRQTLAELLIDADTCDSLFQLQRQVFLCMNAEKDTRQIQEDIMPGLIKNNPLNITRFGISEQEEDPMRDILDPNADDKAMEEVEESIHRMMDMQKAGADIYFGGFSQMKRFGFFYQTVNWFRIFDSRHPSLAHVRRKLNDTTLLDKLIEKGPFCDSDKFSFALGLASVLDRLPQEYRSMLGDAEMFGPIDQMEVMNSAAYIRRMYLQDLYRFFKLAEARKDFRNPFDSANALFFAHEGVAALMPAERMAQLGVKLIVAGEFYGDPKPYMEQIKRLDISDRVVLHTEFIPDHEVNRYFCAADLVAQPYKNATQSGVSQISYHFEKPMLVTHVGGLPEIVPDGKCGFVVTPEAQAIADAIVRYFTEDWQERLTEGVREEKQKYGWDKMTEAIEQLTNNN